MLYLLNKDVRTVRWNGEPLHEATSAVVKETMNGDFTLTLKYPISDSGIYQLIQEDMLIKAPTPVLGAQLFRIKKPVENNDHLEITAYHISDDVMQRSITPMSVTSQSCGMALSRMVQNTKTALGNFSFNSDIQDRRTFNTTETETLYSVLLDGKHSIVGTWEGELVRDNFAMTIKKSRGENRGVVITTHKNLKDYQRTRNSQNVVTRIHAKSTFKPEGAEKETTIRVTVDSPLINSYPYINEKEYENNNAKTVEELQKWAQAKFTNQGIDKVSDAIKIEAFELDGQVVHMGDTVNLKSWKHNVDAFKKAIAYEFDALKEEYISLTFDDKAGVGGSRASGGLSSAADAILGVTESAQEIALEKALQNADLDFDHKAGLLRQEISDGIELARARAEEVKQELSDTINQRFNSFDNGPLQEVKRRSEEALRNAGASSLLAQEAKRIGLDSVAKLEEFKRQATSAQTALSGDLDALKQTVTSEVNQASEYRRTNAEALSRMSGQMHGFATKSEVKQGIDGLTQTFAKMKVGGRNYAEDYDFSRGLWHYNQGDNSPRDWTISNGEYNVKGTTKTWKQLQIHSKEGSQASGKNSTALLDLEIGETYTLSFQGICYSGNPSVWVSLRANRTAPGNPGIINGNFNLTSSWQTYQVTIPALTKPENFDFWRIILGYDGIGHVAFRKVELTRSSTRIDAGPAPEDGKTDLVVAKSEFQKTAEGLSAKVTAVERYVNQDGQRQESLQRYAREESAKQATAVREQISKDYVGKNTFQESVQGVERRLESLSLGTSGNLLKNSNDGFRNQNDKKYRLVETLQANQTYTLVSKYWHGENATGHTFLDGIGNWRHLTYNNAIDAWMVQFTPTQKIPAGTEITLSSDPGGSVGNMSWATLVRGAIPLIHWQPAKGDVEEGIKQKLAEYKETVDGRFATISSQINGKANQADFQRVKETSQLYERILGNSENRITNNVARMALTNQLFQVEVAKSIGSDNNLIVRSKSMDRHKLVNEGNTKRVFVNDGIFTIQCAGNSGYTFAGFTLPLYIDRMARGETYTLNFKYRIMGRLDHEFTVVAKNHQANEGIFSSNIATSSTAVSSHWKEFTETYNITKDFGFGTSNLYPIYFYLAKNGWIEIKEIMLVRASQTNGYKASQFDDMSEAVRSVQSQLAGSWAVQNINSAGDIISGINLGATGHNRITGKLTHITGETLIDNAVIKSAMIDKLKTANFEAGSVTTVVLDAEAVTADKVKMNEAFANKLVASDTFTDTLAAKRGFINQLVSNNIFTNELTAQRGFIQKLVSNDAFTNDLTAKRGFIHQLVSNNIFTNELAAQRGFINQLKSQFISSTFLEGYKGWIGGFQLGTHASGSGRWITGSNHFSVGMGNGEGGDGTTALWVNWGYNWNEAGYYAWYVKNNGKMYCKNTAEFWKTPIIHGDLKVTGNIIYEGGTWVYSPIYNKLTKEKSQGEDWLYLYAQGGGRDWVHMNKQISDRRYKSNIQDSQVSGLDVIEKLKTYSYCKKYDGKVEDIACGIMAQDVQKYAPEAFFENPDGAYSYRTFELVPYLIKAIQELNQKIKLMEEKYESII